MNDCQNPLLRLEGEPSFRDVGGWATVDGRRVRYGLVYRSALMRTLTESDRHRLAQIAFAWRMDLRSSTERAREKPAVETIPAISAGIDELEGAQPALWAQRLEDSNFTTAMARDAQLSTYQQMPLKLAPSLKLLMQRLSSPQGVPVLVHCTAGKDRTGFVCAVLLLTLGVSQDDVMEEYLRSNKHVPDPQVVIARYERYNGITPHPNAAATVLALYRADADQLDCALRRIRSDWGSMDRYLQNVVGLNVAERNAMEDILLQR